MSWRLNKPNYVHIRTCFNHWLTDPSRCISFHVDFVNICKEVLNAHTHTHTHTDTHALKNSRKQHFWFIERELTAIIVIKLEINFEYLNKCHSSQQAFEISNSFFSLMPYNFIVHTKYGNVYDVCSQPTLVHSHTCTHAHMI